MPTEQPTVNVNSAELGEAIARHLRPVMEAIATNAQPKTQEPDRFQMILDAILAGAEDGRVEVKDVVQLLDVHGERLTKAQEGNLVKILQQERSARAVREIDQEIQKYAEHDDLIKESKEIIRQRVIQEFDTDDKYERARQAFTQGHFDEDAKRELVKKHVDRIDKAAERRGEKREDKGAKGITATGANTTEKKQAGDVGEKESLTPNQQDLYASHYGLLIRSGYKAEDAHKESMAAAQRRKK